MQVGTIVTGRSLFTFGGADSRLPLVHLPQLQQAELDSGESGTLADLDLSMRLFGASPLFVQAVIFLVAVVALGRIVSGIARAEPFNSVVQSNWKLLSLTLLGGGLLQALLSTAAWTYFISRIGLHFGMGSVSLETRAEFLGAHYSAIGGPFPQWPWMIIIAGLVALALTAAFRSGAKLEREADGVV